MAALALFVPAHNEFVAAPAIDRDACSIEVLATFSAVCKKTDFLVGDLTSREEAALLKLASQRATSKSTTSATPRASAAFKKSAPGLAANKTLSKKVLSRPSSAAALRPPSGRTVPKKVAPGLAAKPAKPSKPSKSTPLSTNTAAAKKPPMSSVASKAPPPPPPPPPSATAPAAAAASDNDSKEEVKVCEVEEKEVKADLATIASCPYFQQLEGPILFTAPHGTKLWRGDGIEEKKRLHKAERWSTDLALRLADAVKALMATPASYMVWNPRLIGGKADSSHLDPNYLSRSQFASSPWHNFLVVWQQHCRAVGLAPLHVDLHGKKDRDTDWDLDVGVAPIRHIWPQPSFVNAFCDSITKHLQRALQHTKYTVNNDPYLSALWGGDCHTISHQSILLGIPALQLEIPRSLRADLISDANLFRKFAEAIVACYMEVIAVPP
eukprot:TRINITY_DN7045_c0_g2_i3.p1 TRINITY_DN7045_c0_g2~~TRINITY_DN7045_c0_g2_i3.p1  ORF type:complete len:466 (-),score=123.88 TRINITY_DN7045_c0_g2_i3:101-1417(-)